MSDFSTAFAEREYFITVKLKLLVKMILLNATVAIFILHFICTEDLTLLLLLNLLNKLRKRFILGLLSMLSLFRSKFN